MSKENVLSTFICWAKRTADACNRKGLTVRITESAMSSNPSVRLDIDTEAVVGRITCWESGDYDAEIIDLDTERTLYSDHGELRRMQAVGDHFAEFLRIAGI
jgi:hypothetical protein